MSRVAAAVFGIFLSWSDCLQGQEVQGKMFVGVLGGVSTLSADGEILIRQDRTAVSLYSPRNGAAVNILAGVHFNDVFSVQANYLGNRNPLTLTSTLFSDGRQVLYQQSRSSAQHSVVADLLLYFRNRRSWIRPYLSAGAGAAYFRSRQKTLLHIEGVPALPPETFASTKPALRVAVGVDLAFGRGWAFRYSFSETLRNNPISAQLSPAGRRNLANFQNLFGLVKAF